MRNQKPLPKEGSFKEYADNRPSGASKPRRPTGMTRSKSGLSFGGGNDKPDRRQSRGNSFKEDRRSGGNREMFDAVCAKCKKACKVPFKPTTGRSVSCSDCFKPRDRDDRRGSFGGRNDRDRGFKPRNSNQRFARTNSGERELFDAVCSKCNNKCKVPFKPTSGKPVSCSNCFVKRDSGSSRGSFGGRDRDNSRGNNSFGNRRPSNRGRR